jgi:hypothetical protein
MRKNPADSTFILLSNYSFETTDANLNDLIFWWLSLYPSKWVVAAIVEAIYQGRYKVESVSRILNAWSMRGYPVHHFDYDFADVVCKKLSNLGSCGINHLNKRAEKEMETSVTISTLEVPSTTISHSKAAPVDENCHSRTQKVSKNIPNQKIGQCERLVMHLSA